MRSGLRWEFSPVKLATAPQVHAAPFNPVNMFRLIALVLTSNCTI